MLNAKRSSQEKAPPSRRVRMAGMFLRALFIGILIVVTARVASPQNESFWSAYETPGDLIRMALGLSVCLWLAVHVFILPKDQRHSVPGSISVSLFCRWRCYAPSSFGSAYILFIYFSRGMPADQHRPSSVTKQARLHQPRAALIPTPYP